MKFKELLEVLDIDDEVRVVNLKKPMTIYKGRLGDMLLAQVASLWDYNVYLVRLSGDEKLGIELKPEDMEEDED